LIENEKVYIMSSSSATSSSNNGMVSTAAASAATGGASHRQPPLAQQQPPPPQRPAPTASRRPTTTTATTTAMTATTTSNNNRRRGGRRLFALFGMNQLQFQCSAQTVLDATMNVCTIFVEKLVLVLGPMLIVFASVIIGALTHTFFTIILPLLNHLYHDWPVPGGGSWYAHHVIISLHIGMVLFLLTNIIFNYFMCVTTRNKGPAYDQVVRELAVATNFVYPESPAALEQFRRDYEDRMILRMRRRQVRERELSQQRVDAARLAREEQQQRQQQQKAAATAAAALSTTTTSISTTSTTLSLDTPAANSSNTDDLESCSSSSNMGSSGVVTLRKNAVPSSNAPTDVGTGTHANGTMTTTNSPKKRPVLRNSTTTTRPAPPKQALPSPKFVRNWMLMAPDEWGYCTKSHQAKPPRSHYDHVTKTLVLCLDHFCPWMFNAIGYFNYRYFCNFLWFVELGMMYGAAVTYVPFSNLGSPQYKEQVRHYRLTKTWQRLHPMTPFPYERMALSLSFMLCLAIGIAVFCLASFHAYLVLTGQTTIEFHGNWVARSKFYKDQKQQAAAAAAVVALKQAQQNGDNHNHLSEDNTDPSRKRKQWRNPYDLGYRRNWQQVYGCGHPLWAVIVPSTRRPEFLPLPIAGEAGRRREYHRSLSSANNNKKDKEDSVLDVEQGTRRIRLPEEHQALVV
jgi:hypothetical protein